MRMGPKVNSKHSKKGQKTESYLAEDKNFESFAAQLNKLGLELRDITGKLLFIKKKIIKKYKR
jgi:hypothetical protein